MTDPAAGERTGTPARLSGPSPRRALLGEAARTLRAAGVEGAWVEAQLLLAHVLGVGWGAVLQGDDVDPADRARLHELVARRARREPLQHITGVAPFRWLEVAVGPGVFVPRPETELLVDLVAPDLAPPGAGDPTSGDPTAGPLVVDLCSGSGAVALALAQEHPSARVVAVERSPAALAWLRRNAAARVAAGDTPVEVVAADVADWRPAPLAGRVDVVVANPPYVPLGREVAAEVRADPAEAVFAGADGLGLLPALAATAARLLRPGGRLAVEHDDAHAAQVRELLAAAGFTDVVTELDLTGRERFATARRGAHTAAGQDGAPWG